MPEKLNLYRSAPGGGAVGEARSPIAVSPVAYPLDEFYAQAGRPLPRIETVAGAAVPEPFQSLLVHNNDMTPTLENYYGTGIHLRVLSRQQRDDFYFREVLLLLNGADRPVEFGAIKINLALFPPAARREILAERLPLGHVLRTHDITHASRPKAFLKIQSDSFICEALRAEVDHPALYGRRNSLVDPVQRSLAEIVEILPPATVG